MTHFFIDGAPKDSDRETILNYAQEWYKKHKFNPIIIKDGHTITGGLGAGFFILSVNSQNNTQNKVICLECATQAIATASNDTSIMAALISINSGVRLYKNSNGEIDALEDGDFPWVINETILCQYHKVIRMKF